MATHSASIAGDHFPDKDHPHLPLPYYHPSFCSREPCGSVPSSSQRNSRFSSQYRSSISFNILLMIHQAWVILGEVILIHTLSSSS